MLSYHTANSANDLACDSNFVMIGMKDAITHITFLDGCLRQSMTENQTVNLCIDATCKSFIRDLTFKHCMICVLLD